MPRQTRFALLVAATLLVVVTGTVLGTRALAPSDGATTANDADGSPEAGALAHAADRLGANRIELEEEVLRELAAQYGIGGAVRIEAWAALDAGDDITVDSVRAMRDGDGGAGSGMGWGQIARELGVRPGIGSIMSNGGNGHGKGNGGGGPPLRPGASP